jgi:CheY-like chemotaxis protein
MTPTRSTTSRAIAPSVAIAAGDPGVREVMSASLGLEGYQVLLCATGRALLAKARWYAPPAVVAFDLNLPDMSSGQCLHALRTSPWGHVPTVIFTSGSASERLGLLRAIDRLVRRPRRPQAQLSP